MIILKLGNMRKPATLRMFLELVGVPGWVEVFYWIGVSFSFPVSQSKEGATEGIRRG